MIAFSYPLILPLTKSHFRRLHYLHCSLRKFYDNIGATTPIDIYLWVSNDPLSTIPAWLHEDYPQLIVLPIVPSSWQAPTDFPAYETWQHAGQFPLDYYLHSRWRLTFAMDFVKAMGYSYVLLTDDDTFITNTIPVNLVEEFTRAGILIAHRDRHILEKAEYVTGLAEFTRYWMSIRDFAQPLGPLFDHLQPSNVSGLTVHGWDRQIYTGCFSIVHVDLWYAPVIQDYLHHILRNGGDLHMRWTEQGVQNMIRLLFVPPERSFFFPAAFGIVHGQPKRKTLPLLGCPNTVERLLLPYQRSEEEIEAEKAVQAGVHVHKMILLMGMYPLEIADFDWSCAQYGTAMQIPCEEDPYASLPFYLEAFCHKYVIPVGFCEVLRSSIAKEVGIEESRLIINETDMANRKVYFG